MSLFGFIGSFFSFICFTNKVSLNPFIIAHVYNYHSSNISYDFNQKIPSQMGNAKTMIQIKTKTKMFMSVARVNQLSEMLVRNDPIIDISYLIYFTHVNVSPRMN